MSEHNRDQRYLAMRRVTIVGALVNLLLAGVKIVLGVIGQSQALVADGVHSLSDLITDVLVLVAAKHSTRAADESHPYGHARIETAATVGLGAFLIAVAVGIGWDAAHRLVSPDLLLHPGVMALGGAIFSILANEGLYHYTVAVARRVRSQLLRANAWHHRSDAISSVVVVIGVGGSMAGVAYLDAAAAIVVAAMIAKIGWDLAHQGLRELIDTSLEPEKVEIIRDSILSVDGVKALHLLKTRRMGADALVDVHILLASARMSVSEGHQISEAVRARVMADVDDVAEVMVHIDPEDDEVAAPCRHLPLRQKAMARLEALWAPIDVARHIQRVNLHYLSGRLHVDVYLPLSVLQESRGAEDISAAFSRASKADKDVAEVHVYFG